MWLSRRAPALPGSSFIRTRPLRAAKPSVSPGELGNPLQGNNNAEGKKSHKDNHGWPARSLE